ncbi:LAME_0B00628g1_1 [Lachancea meyersii CBS 8951]|uniref:DNA damage checkpoint control protein RAD17 n=1 Tax=Lachancea meyersii CBS 8951 TaxID=1266667 RepID=A0A1G4ISM3_9SACH|nr:LAME_0B00628g1_1 [Lachancea meyersii CBS 8951]
MLDQTTLFSASTVHLEHITTALSCLTPFGIKDDVLIIIDKDGLSFARQNNKVISIQLYLSAELFISYNYNPPNNDPDAHHKVCVKIHHILDSISVASRDKDDVVECTLSYNGEGSPFVLIFEDSVITEKVEYSTYLVKEWDSVGLELQPDAITLECIMRGDVLYNALQDMKEIGCKECYLYAIAKTGGKNTFALVSRGQLGLSKILLPSEKSILKKLEIFDPVSFEKTFDLPVIGVFDFTSFDKIRSSARIASKVLLRKDVHGLMNVNILSQTDDLILGEVKRSRTAPKVGTMPLSRDYPGIVIDVAILEKARLDEADVSEMRLLMESSEQIPRPIYDPTGVPAKSFEGNGAATPERDNCLLFGVRNMSADITDTAAGEYVPATNDIPLFF